MSKSNQRLFSVYGSPHQTLGVNVPDYQPGTHPVRYEWLHGVRIEQRPDLHRIGAHEVVTIANGNAASGTSMINNTASYVVHRRQNGTTDLSDDLLNQADFIMPNIYRYAVPNEMSQAAATLIQAALGEVPEAVMIPMELRRLILGNGLSRMLPAYFDQFLWIYPQAPAEVNED